MFCHKLKFITITISTLAIFCFVLPTLAATCSATPSAATMTQNFVDALEAAASKTDRVAVLDFDNPTLPGEDALMAHGISVALYDMFADATPGFLHPYVVRRATAEFGGSEMTLEKVKRAAEKLKARLVIYGSVQRQNADSLRVFLYAYDAKSQNTLPKAQEIAILPGDAFFPALRQAAVSASQTLKSVKLNDSKILPDPDFAAFRYYVKGIDLAGVYDQQSLESADSWLEKALKDSYNRYPDAALNLARARAMLATWKRAAGGDSAAPLRLAAEALSWAGNLPKDSKKLATTKRFFDGAEKLAQAWNAHELGKADLASKIAAEGLQILREDAVLQALYLISPSGRSPTFIADPLCL